MTPTENSREALLRVAKKLFCEKSYDGTTVKELAEAADVNVAMINYFFDGKEGLYRECLAEFGNRNLAVAERILQSPKSQEEVRVRLEMFFQELMSAQIAEPEVCNILHRECSFDFPIAQEVFQKSFLKVFQKMVEFLTHAQKAKFIRKDVDPIIVASIHFGALCNTVRMDRVSHEFFNRTLNDKKHRENFMTHILDSLFRSIGITGKEK